MPDDPLRRRFLDRRYGESVGRLDTGGTTPDSLAAASTELLAAVLRDRGRLRSRLQSAAWRTAATGDMVRRTERFLNLRAQYASLSAGERQDMTGLYARLLDELRDAFDLPAVDLGPALDAATGDHLHRLLGLLEAADHGEALTAAARGDRSDVCAAYRPALQVAVLGVAPEAMLQPVLDLGAGADGALVAYLRDRGVDACGVDRLADGAWPHLQPGDWLTWEVGRDRWGTILSHMGFSNHFLHHHRRGGDEAVRYAARWVELLAAVRVGGRLHYAPALPFVESLLAPATFEVRHIPIPGVDARDAAVGHATTITRRR